MPIEQPEAHLKAQTERSERIQKILAPENWPPPKWYEKKKEKRKKPTFDEYFSFELQTRYLALENDLRTVLGNYPDAADVITAECISHILHATKKSLEDTDPNLLAVSSALNLVDRYMVWLDPGEPAKARIESLLLKLNTLSFVGKELLVQRLTKLSEGIDESHVWKICSVLDEAVGLINDQVIQIQISSGLQITRLKLLRNWGLIILMMFLIGSPFVTNLGNTGNWPSQSIISGSSTLINAWMNAFAMLLVGGVGGFLSGLLQARSTQVTLTEYLEDILKLQLKPLVGAMVALILYVVLSWQVLPGIKIENTGSYIIIAFLSGFSERYFLRLLDIKTEDEKSMDQVEKPIPMNSPIV